MRSSNSGLIKGDRFINGFLLLSFFRSHGAVDQRGALLLQDDAEFHTTE